jgi:hypothetical protein
VELLDGQAVLIPPGEVRQLGWVLDRWPNLIFADTPLRVYVIDSRGRQI